MHTMQLKTRTVYEHRSWQVGCNWCQLRQPRTNVRRSFDVWYTQFSTNRGEVCKNDLPHHQISQTCNQGCKVASRPGSILIHSAQPDTFKHDTAAYRERFPSTKLLLACIHQLLGCRHSRSPEDLQCFLLVSCQQHWQKAPRP